MKLTILLATCCLCSALAEGPATKRYTIPSWGDYAVVYGPGTDPAMDSQAGMEAMFKFWQARGFSGVFLRTDLQQYEPFVRRNPRVQMNPALALMWRQVDEIGKSFDYFEAAQQAANRTGFEFWVSHPHIYSDGAPEDIGVPGHGRMVPWSYVSTSMFEHRETVMVDRKGNKYWMVREYAYPEARRSKVGEFVHMAKKYGAKHFLASLRTEVNQLIEPTDKADRFGFNQPVVDDMKRLHGVDIMTDARFDVDSPAFDPSDPMLQKWRDLRGSYVTQLFRELRQALDAIDPAITIAVTLAGESVGPPLGNWRTDWRAWVDEGLVDYFISPVMFEASLDHDAAKKGYLTNVRAGVGTVSHAVLSDYIQQSKHPEIKVIAAGGPPYFFPPTAVPAKADGLQCDVWYSSYHLAWFQRWGQWMRDLKEFGHIKFIEQNFDAVAPGEFAGISGGWGMYAYDPKVRACAGAWWRLGTGSDAKPFAQKAVRRGGQGQAIQLTRTTAASGTITHAHASAGGRLSGAVENNGTLTGWHNASPDRSGFTAALDSAITNGICTFECWLFRKTAESSLAAYLQGDGSAFDVGVRVAPDTGRLSYSTGTVAGAGRWVETAHSMPVGQWEKITLRVDLDRRTYSAEIGDAKKIMLCDKVSLEMPKERFMEQAGVNIPIAVPVYKQFQRVFFTPEGADGNITFLDDVSVKWQPTLHFVEPGPTVEFADDFESYAGGTQIGDPTEKSAWTLQPADLAAGYRVIADTSYGHGVKSLYTTGGTKLIATPQRPLTLTAPLALDFDVFVRSSASFPYIIPNPETKSPHRTTVGITRADGSMIAGVFAGEGTWQIWNGSAWSDSGVRIDYDVWNHVQLALDGTDSYQVAVQPVGQVATMIGKGRIGTASAGDALKLVIEPSKTPGHITCYDNVRLTSGHSPAATPQPVAEPKRKEDAK